MKVDLGRLAQIRAWNGGDGEVADQLAVEEAVALLERARVLVQSEKPTRGGPTEEHPDAPYCKPRSIMLRLLLRELMMTEIESCETCKFRIALQCRKSPPVRLPRAFAQTANANNRVRDENLIWGWPAIEARDWCGEWRQR